MSSAIFCNHANEVPACECSCIKECYCKNEGSCRSQYFIDNKNIEISLIDIEVYWYNLLKEITKNGMPRNFHEGRESSFSTR